jgi:hypothetical protein
MKSAYTVSALLLGHECLFGSTLDFEGQILMNSNYIQHYRCSVDSSSRACSVRDALKVEVVGRYGTS